MVASRGLAAGLVLIWLLALAGPAEAQHRRDPGEVEITGVIVALRPQDPSFVLREDRRQDRLWVVQVQPWTRIEIRVRELQRRDEEDVAWASGFGGGFRRLRVGQIVEVEGRRSGDRRLIAGEITIIGRVHGVPPRVIVPPPPARFPRPPHIFYPQDGAEIHTAEFMVVGQTVPRAHVRIEVAPVWAFFTFSPATTETVADGNGIFAATIRPPVRLSGTTYRITVRASAFGRVFPPVSLVVHQR